MQGHVCPWCATAQLLRERGQDCRCCQRERAGASTAVLFQLHANGGQERLLSCAHHVPPHALRAPLLQPHSKFQHCTHPLLTPGVLPCTMTCSCATASSTVT
jgi:hypothetical protein